MPQPNSFMHHIGVFASDFEASRRFYTAVLGELGITIGYQVAGIAEFWRPGSDTPSLSLETADSQTPVTRGVHIAFAAASRRKVEAVFDAAMESGAAVRHQPQYWTLYRAYCCFVSDPDGNNIEAVHKE